jgi:hypothetical protein
MKSSRHFGEKVAEKLRHRLADFRAATSVANLVAGRPREIKVDGHSYIAVELCEKVRIVFCANHNVVPACESGEVDWSQVNRIKIVAIDTNHA